MDWNVSLGGCGSLWYSKQLPNAAFKDHRNNRSKTLALYFSSGRSVHQKVSKGKGVLLLGSRQAFQHPTHR